MKSWAFGGGAALLLCSLAMAQEAGEILGRSETALFKFANWDIELTTIYDVHTQQTTSRTQSIKRYVRSGKKTRTEGQNSPTTVADGIFSWTYYPGGGKYIKHPSAIQEPVLWVPYSSLNARLLGEESVTISERQFPCWVIDLPSQPRQPHVFSGPATLWIDKSTYLPLKRRSVETNNYLGQGQREMTSTYAVTKMLLDQSPPDSLFEPDLPPDAVEVKQLGFAKRASSIGEPARH